MTADSGRPTTPEGFHNQYTCQCISDAVCIHLRSSNAVLFCIHPAILKSASNFFRSTLPPGPLNNEIADLKVDGVIQVSEQSEVLEVLLGVASGQAIDLTKMPTIEHILEVLGAAEKYEMNGVISTVGFTSLSSWSPFHDHPLELASACHRYGWADEYRIALERTLSLHVSAPDVLSKLCTLDGAVASHIYQIRCLTTKRFKEKLFACEDDFKGTKSDSNFVSESNSECKWRRAYTFLRWKFQVMHAYRRDPSGQTGLGNSFTGGLFGRYNCYNSGAAHKHEMESAQLSWMMILTRILADVASERSEDLDACLRQGTLPRSTTPEPSEEQKPNQAGPAPDGVEGITTGGFHSAYPCTHEAGSTHLRSSAGTYYCTNLRALKSASGFLRSANLPCHEERPNTESDLVQDQTLEISEPSWVVEIFLGVANGHAFDLSAIPTLEHARDVLGAAEKYEMPGVISTIRYTVLSSLSPFHDHCLQLAATSHRHGWSHEYRVALERTLSVDVSVPEIFFKMCALDGVIVTNVHRLRASRIDQLKDKLFAAIDDITWIGNDPTFQETKHSICTKRRSEVFLRWKWVILEEFTAHPSGHTLLKELFSSDPRMTALTCECLHAGQVTTHDLKVAKLFWMSLLREILESISGSLSIDLDLCLGSSP